MHTCEQVPENPANGERFSCPGCGYTREYVVLDERPGEWVDA